MYLGLIHKILDDVAAGDDSYEYIPVINHRHEILVLRLLQQILHGGIDTGRPHLAVLQEIPHGSLLQILQRDAVQALVICQYVPEEIRHAHDAHVPVFHIDDRYGREAASAELLKALPQRHVVPQIGHLCLGQ